MREIKFRAWDKYYRTMCRVDVVTDKGAHLVGLPVESDWEESEEGYVVLSKGQRFRYNNEIDLMQYTGLKDKNKVEIYDGDIVECKVMHDININYWVIKPPRWIVEWNTLGANFALKHTNDLPFDLSSYWEVIGNIYENKELL